MLEAIQAKAVPIIGKSLTIAAKVRDYLDCGVEVAENVWEIHMKSSEHIANSSKTKRLFEVASPNKFCFFCQINVEDRRRLYHLRTERNRFNTAHPSQFKQISLIKSACQDRILGLHRQQ